MRIPRMHGFPLRLFASMVASKNYYIWSKIRIIRLVQKYKDNTRTYEVTTYGKKDEGVAIVAFNMPTNSSALAKDVVELMWQSLLIK